MITKVKYATLDESVEDASEVYFWENAMKISYRFVEGFIKYESEWVNKRMAPFSDGAYQPGTMVFGTSVLKNKPVALINKK